MASSCDQAPCQTPQHLRYDHNSCLQLPQACPPTRQPTASRDLKLPTRSGGPWDMLNVAFLVLQVCVPPGVAKSIVASEKEKVAVPAIDTLMTPPSGRRQVIFRWPWQVAQADSIIVPLDLGAVPWDSEDGAHSRLDAQPDGRSLGTRVALCMFSLVEQNDD